MKQLLQVIHYALTPIAPWRWKEAAVRISHGVGWEPPMLMIASLGVVLPLNFGLGVLGNNQFAKTFNLATTITWFIVASIASLIVILRSLRNIVRYGSLGFTRANWWFECGRLSMIASLFAIISLPLMMLMPFRNQLGFLPDILLSSSKIFACLFLATATTGYLVSFVATTHRLGKAYQCVHYFYCTLVPMGILTAAAMCWPQAVFWPNGFVVACAFVMGCVLWGCGVFSVIRQHERWSTAARAAQSR